MPDCGGYAAAIFSTALVNALCATMPRTRAGSVAHPSKDLFENQDKNNGLSGSHKLKKYA
jgi:hypothetical protein